MSSTINTSRLSGEFRVLTLSFPKKTVRDTILVTFPDLQTCPIASSTFGLIQRTPYAEVFTVTTRKDNGTKRVETLLTLFYT